MNGRRWYIALIAACISTTVAAAERDEYNRSLAEHFTALFRMNDVNKDNLVSREEASGTIALVAYFNDIDINRDGYITQDELTRFIETSFR